MAGVQGRGLQALLAHKDPRMTMRYSHVAAFPVLSVFEGRDVILPIDRPAREREDFAAPHSAVECHEHKCPEVETRVD